MAEQQPDPDLEVECPECRGTGLNYTDGHRQWWRKCGNCENGFILTPLGEKCLELVKRRFKQLLKENMGV
jgi:hypothetical protein